MKISELISKLDLSKKEKYYIHEEFLYEFDTNFNDVDFDKINLDRIWLTIWYCTDTRVGTSILLLKDIPVCICNHIARKAAPEFFWINDSCFLKVEEIVEAAKIKKELNFQTLDLKEEFKNTYGLEFANDLIPKLHKYAFFNHKKVTVQRTSSKDFIERNVKITFEDGTTQIVEICELEFPILGLKNNDP